MISKIITQEEKAKAYDKAIKTAEEYYKEGKTLEYAKDLVSDIFPELKESEDDKIRKNCIHFLELQKSHHAATFEIDECIAWLEKQGERKSSDKVEPKFKIGDWITNGHATCQITFIDSRYWYSETCVLGNVIDIDKTFHLWDITKDAKDGDVLVDSLPFIFKRADNLQRSYAYCGISVDYSFRVESEGEFGEWTWAQDIKPATKEQRDFLFQKMKEAGYEWDAEKKELKKESSR